MRMGRADGEGASAPRECEGAMSRSTTLRSWAAVTAVASSTGPSRTQG